MINTSNLSVRKMRWKLFLLGLFKIPILYFVGPKLILITDSECIIRIKLRRRTKNHLNSMYFAALAVGADVAAGIHAFYFSEKHKVKISLAFKSMQAEFIKRADTDIYFCCNQGELINKMIQDSIIEKHRINRIVYVKAMNKDQEVVATFNMELSLKVIS